MQDESERGVCFSHKMSLKDRGVGMLGIDYPSAKRQQAEPATDPAVSPLQRGDSIQRQRAGRDLHVGGAHASPARLQPPEPRRQRAAAAVSGQDDRTEPGANHAAGSSSTGRAENSNPPATGGIALPASTRPPTSNCWRRWTRPTKPSAARPRARSSSGITSSTSGANTSGWRGSRWPRSIACGGAEPTASGGCISPRPGPRRCRSASGAGPTRKANPAFCEWIRCIKGIAMASRASTTSCRG